MMNVYALPMTIYIPQACVNTHKIKALNGFFLFRTLTLRIWTPNNYNATRTNAVIIQKLEIF